MTAGFPARAPAGRRVAVDGYGDKERPVWTIDLRTGKVLGRQDDGEYHAPWRGRPPTGS